jgi:hypothetical protein
MNPRSKMTVAVLLMSIFLFGCASTETVGNKLVNLSTPVSRIGVIVLQSNFSDSAFRNTRAATYSTNKTLAELVPRLPKRTEAVFAANDIESKTILASSSGSKPPAEDIAQLKDFQHLLIIQPTSSTYQSHGGGVSVEMRAAIIDRHGKQTIWQGAIMFRRAGSAVIDDSVADKFSREILLQLNKDGVIKLKNSEPVLPKS